MQTLKPSPTASLMAPSISSRMRRKSGTSRRLRPSASPPHQHAGADRRLQRSAPASGRCKCVRAVRCFEWKETSTREPRRSRALWQASNATSSMLSSGANFRPTLHVQGRDRFLRPLHIFLEICRALPTCPGTGSVLRYRTGLSPQLSETAILATAAYWKAEFEFEVHAGEAIKAERCRNPLSRRSGRDARPPSTIRIRTWSIGSRRPFTKAETCRITSSRRPYPASDGRRSSNWSASWATIPCLR